MRIYALTAICAMITVSVAHASEDPTQSIFGSWARGDGKAHVKIERCGENLCAINTWIRSGVTGEHVGDKLVMSVKPNGGKLAGTAFDPQRKLSLTLTVDVADQRLTTNGCVLGGIICTKMGWTRLSAN